MCMAGAAASAMTGGYYDDSEAGRDIQGMRRRALTDRLSIPSYHVSARSRAAG